MIPEHLKKFPQMCREAVEIAERVELPYMSFNKIDICGMGGSGSAGDLVADLLRYDSPIEVKVVKSYHLPASIDDNTIVFCVSYSGNTEETLSAFLEAKKRGHKIISITSGGKLKDWCKKLDFPLIQIPSGYQPRDALPYMFFPIIIILQKLGRANFADAMNESLSVIDAIDLKYLDRLAEKLKASDIAIYGTDEYSGVVHRFKNQFNENAKMVVKYDCFPEMNHNEINGYERSDLTKNSHIILLRDKNERAEMKATIEIVKNILSDRVNSIHELWAVGDTKLAKIISFVFMASYITAKISETVGIKRERVLFVEKLKTEMKNKLNFVEKLENDNGL